MLPEILLDDIHFQELVSEARTRIVRHSPDWTDHNVSDPGITLIELFAWLTEILVYRINRIPERLHLALLELIGVRLSSPRAASVEVSFILEDPAVSTTIPAGTEVATPRTPGSDPVVFQTVDDLVIPQAGLAAFAIQRSGRVKELSLSGGFSEPSGDERPPFGRPPGVGNAFLLGFDEQLSGTVIRATLECEPARQSGPDRDPLQLAWEASGADGSWHEAVVLDDDTGGLQLGSGAITVAIPPEARAAAIGNKKRLWLRCRLDQPLTSSALAPPDFARVSAGVVGGTVAAVHSSTVYNERIGVSDGVHGVSYPLRNRPVRPLQDGETLEVCAPGHDTWETWRTIENFTFSLAADTHFTLDLARGEVRFGPAVRQPHGGWRHYGAVPPAGALMRFTRYRHGGGMAGNVAARALSNLQTPVANVKQATNPRPARGGIDGESLESARERAILEVRARTRAVTAEDFERLTTAASPGVARAICVPPNGAGAIRIHVLPRVEPADRRLTVEELLPDERLMESVASALDERRLLGSTIQLVPVRLRGVSVVADIRASPRADLERVQQDVAHALYVYLNPLIGGTTDGPGRGWPLGRALNQGELFGIAYAISGVELVNLLRVYETDIITGEQAAQPTEGHMVLRPGELIASGNHIIKVTHRE